MRFYLDHNATSPLDPRVRERLVERLADGCGNPNSLHAEGRRARAALEDAREEAAAALGVPPAAIVFTSGGTEANNLAIRSLASRLRPGGLLAISAVEHPSVAEAALREARRRPDLDLRLLPVDRDGRLLDPGSTLAGSEGVAASIVLAQSEAGTLQPVAEVAATVHARGGVLHTDASQALGRVPLAEAVACCDLVTLTLHKCGGPTGIGLLVAKDPDLLEPLLVGGGQERGARAGTEAVPLACAAALALRLAVTETGERAERMRAARDAFSAALRALEHVRFPGAGAPRLPNTASVSFLGVDGRALLLGLDLAGIAASIGSACASRSARPSPALLAMGCTTQEALATVRFSFGAGADRHAAVDAAALVASVFSRLSGQIVSTR